MRRSGLDSLIIQPLVQQAFGDSPLAGILTQELTARRGGGGGGNPGLGGSQQQYVQMAKRMAAKYGWTGDQWKALKKLWMAESGFDPNAANPTSSARGIPQAMMSIHFGDEWKNSTDAKRFLRNPRKQIKWGLDYISGKYGDPITAYGGWSGGHFDGTKGY